MFTNLDLQNLAKGMYIATVSLENGKLLHTEKIIKE
jgi:hypothetical protein